MFYSQTLCFIVSSILLAKPILVESYDVFEKVYYDLDFSEKLFQNYISKFQKHYTHDEFEHRFQAFQDNLRRINKLNKERPSTVFGLNKFTDMTPEEFKATFGCVYNTTGIKQEEIPDIQAPQNLDYRKQNLVTEIKNQLNCGSCYIFGAMGDIEGQHAKKHKELISLSEQYPLDCNEDFDCGGGYIESVAIWLSTTAGAVKTEDYPYIGSKAECQKDKKGVVKVKGARKSSVRTHEQLKKVLAKHGPLTIALYFNEFVAYDKGIFTPYCMYNEPPNHAVVLVGYSGDENYWILKNSWGTDWGEDGYVRVDIDNNCGIGSLIAPSEVY